MSKENERRSGTSKEVLNILNNLFFLDQKVDKLDSGAGLKRHLDRIREDFAALGLTIENPLGQEFSETRTDCEATIAGESTENLVVTEVVKPLIRYRRKRPSFRDIDEGSFIAQRAIVIVESRPKLVDDNPVAPGLEIETVAGFESIVGVEELPIQPVTIQPVTNDVGSAKESESINPPGERNDEHN